MFDSKPGLGLAILVVLTSSLLFTWRHMPLNNPEYPLYDAHYYKLMSQGKFSDVHKTMTRRILHPATAGGLSRLLNLDLEKSYFLTGFLSSMVFLTVYLILFQSHTRLSYLTAIPIILSPPFFQQLFLHYHPPDLFFGGLFLLFILALARNQIFVGCLLLVLLFLTRESSTLISIPLIVVAFWRKKIPLAVGAILSTVIGMMAISQFMKLGKPNIHDLSEPVYLLGKAIFNSSRNFLGVHLYVNTQDQCLPKFVYPLPQGLPLGGIKEIGFCSFDPWWAIFTLNSFLTIFGLGPFVCLMLLKKKGKVLLKNGEIWLLTALMTGFISFVIGPALANEPYRMLVYAWPAFWLAAPVLYARYFDVTTPESRYLLALHVLLAWLPTLLGFLTDSLPAHRLLVLSGAILIYWTAFPLLKHFSKEDPWTKIFSGTPPK